MDIAVLTGQTKSKRGTALVAESMKSLVGEEVLLLLQIEAPPDEAKTLEKECVTIVKHALLETEGEASVRLDGTLKELNGLFKGLTLSQSVGEVHAIVAVVDAAGVLHVSHAGRAEAYVVRGGAASQITEYTRGKPTPAFVHIASGGLEPRDAIIFSSQRLLRSVTPAQIVQIAQRGDHLLDELVMELESEREQAAIGVLLVKGRDTGKLPMPLAGAMGRKSHRPGKSGAWFGRRGRGNPVSSTLSAVGSAASSAFEKSRSLIPSGVGARIGAGIGGLLSDLRNPRRRRRAHLLLLAGVVAVFLIVWAVVNLSTSVQSSQTREELETRIKEISEQIRTAENRRIAGEVDSANAILLQAEERAKQVMDNDSNLFRSEALDLLERIRVKREEINNIARLTPRLVANLGTKNKDIDVQGIIGLSDSEFIVYDRQDLYRVLLNSVEDPDRLTEEELILDGDDFPRFQTLIFQVTDNSIIELINEQATAMKTEDPAGWIKGSDIETYLRFLYVLSPENNQIYKYERLSNRYGAPAEYNVNGDVSDALDIAIDSNIYVLKKGGEVVKLLRGEVKPFAIRHLPEGALDDAMRVFKVSEGHLYFLDPVHARVIVATDGGVTGEASYVKQYQLEGDQVGALRDIFVDEEETKLFVSDDKKIHVVDLGTK